MNSKDKVFNAYRKANIQGKSNILALRFPQLDDDILEYIRAMNARSYPVNRGIVTAYAKVITNTKYKMHELPKKDRLTFSDGWLTDLFKRIGV